MPGGPYVYYPIAAALLQAGASLGVLVAFVTAKNVWSMTRLPMEFALLGPHLTLVRFVATLILSPLLGFLADALGNSILFIVIPLYVAALPAPWFPLPDSVRVGFLISLYGLVNAAFQPF